MVAVPIMAGAPVSEKNARGVCYGHSVAESLGRPCAKSSDPAWNKKCLGFKPARFEKAKPWEQREPLHGASERAQGQRSSAVHRRQGRVSLCVAGGGHWWCDEWRSKREDSCASWIVRLLEHSIERDMVKHRVSSASMKLV